MKEQLGLDEKTSEKEKSTSVKITYSITKLSFETSGLNAEENTAIFQTAFGLKLVGIMIMLTFCLLLFWALGQPKWLLELF